LEVIGRLFHYDLTIAYKLELIKENRLLLVWILTEDVEMHVSLLTDECNTYRKTLHSRTKGLFTLEYKMKIETVKTL